jgi:hypothetical protein
MHWVVSRSYKERFKLLCNTWCYGCLGYVPLRARRDHQPTAQAKFWKIFKGLRKFWKSVEWLNRGRRSRILTYFLHLGCGCGVVIVKPFFGRLSDLGGWLVNPSTTESRKDQVIKRFSNPVFDFWYPICGPYSPHQKSPTYHTPSPCTSTYYYGLKYYSLFDSYLYIYIYIYIREGWEVRGWRASNEKRKVKSEKSRKRKAKSEVRGTRLARKGSPIIIGYLSLNFRATVTKLQAIGTKILAI